MFNRANGHLASSTSRSDRLENHNENIRSHSAQSKLSVNGASPHVNLKMNQPLQYGDSLGDDGGSHDTEWVCSACSLINPRNEVRCQVCEAEKSSGIDKIKNQRDQLSVINGNSPAQNQPVLSEKNDVWVCRRCTLENSQESNRCEVCESPRKSNIPTSVPSNAEMDCSYSLPKTDMNGTSPEKTKSQVSQKNSKPNEGIFSSLVAKIPFFKSPASASSASGGTPSTITSSASASFDNDYDLWTCEKCSFSCNPQYFDHCELCKVPRKAKSNENLNSDLIMDTNHFSQITNSTNDTRVAKDAMNKDGRHSPYDVFKKPGTSKHKHDKASEWNCRRCTFSNALADNLCSMCGAKKELPDPVSFDSSSNDSAKTQSQKWRCNKCTFINDKSSDLCICGHSKNENLFLESGNKMTFVKDGENQDMKSHLSEDLKEREKEASEQLTSIVAYCKTVSVSV